MRHMQYVSIIIGIICLTIMLVDMSNRLHRVERVVLSIAIEQDTRRILATPPTVIGSTTLEYSHPIHRMSAEDREQILNGSQTWIISP